MAAFYPSAEAGCRALEAVLGSGLQPAALEYLDDGAVLATRGAFPVAAPDAARFILIADADGSAQVCSSSEWLNGQSNPLSESYHPNISGQAEFTSLVEAVRP